MENIPRNFVLETIEKQLKDSVDGLSHLISELKIEEVGVDYKRRSKMILEEKIRQLTEARDKLK